VGAGLWRLIVSIRHVAASVHDQLSSPMARGMGENCFVLYVEKNRSVEVLTLLAGRPLFGGWLLGRAGAGRRRFGRGVGHAVTLGGWLAGAAVGGREIDLRGPLALSGAAHGGRRGV